MADEHPARALYRVAPAAYVDERARVAKALKAAGDTEIAKIVQRLKRPTIAMWGVLAAAANADDVRELVTVSHDLLAAHDGGDRATILELTKRRRAALTTVVRAAVDSLRPYERSANARQSEMRMIADQLSRHPELMQSWIDGVLRDVPEGDGLAGIMEFAVSTKPGAGQRVEPKRPTTDHPSADPSRPERRLKSVPTQRPDDAPTTESGAEALERQRAAAERRRAEEREARNARAARAVATREARRDVDIAVKALAAAQRRVDAAEAVVREAEASLRSLEDDRDAAVQRHHMAADRLSNLTSD